MLAKLQLGVRVVVWCSLSFKSKADKIKRSIYLHVFQIKLI